MKGRGGEYGVHVAVPPRPFSDAWGPPLTYVRPSTSLTVYKLTPSFWLCFELSHTGGLSFVGVAAFAGGHGICKRGPARPADQVQEVRWGASLSSFHSVGEKVVHYERVPFMDGLMLRLTPAVRGCDGIHQRPPQSPHDHESRLIPFAGITVV